MDDNNAPVEREITVKMSPQYKEISKNRSIPHAVVMREYGSSRCLNQLSSEFRIAAEEKLILKEHKEMKCELPDFTRSTYLMVFSPDGKKMASSHGNHNVYVTDVKTGKNLNTLSGHPRTPWCIAFHPSSNQILASGCLGGQVRVWDLHGGSEIWTVEGQTCIASLAFHPSDRLLVIASYNEILFWDWSQPEPFAKCSTLNEKEKIRYVAFDYSGTKLITGIEIPKPVVSQWDRVGPGGHVNHPPGPSGPRPSGQRPVFGPVFSRPSQESEPVSPAVSLSPTFNAQHRASASQLVGRIRQNVQLLQLLLDARRIAQHDLNRDLPRRHMANESTRSISSGISGSQENSSEVLRDEATPASLLDQNRRTNLLAGISLESRESNHHTIMTHSEIPRVFGSRGLNGNILSPPSPSPSDSQPVSTSISESHRLESNDQTIIRGASSRVGPSRLQNTDFSGESSFEPRDVNHQRLFSNSGSPPSNRNERRSTSRAANLRTSNTSTFSRQPSSTSRNADLNSQVNSLSDEIRRTLNILSEHVDDMQHCSVCLPRMNSSRLSHIQQLWAELREQIRSLQSSIWENTTLASNAWHRLSFEAITEMLSHMSQRDVETTSERSRRSTTSPGSRGNRSQSNPALSTPGTSSAEDSSFSQTPSSNEFVYSAGPSVASSRFIPFSRSYLTEPSASTAGVIQINRAAGSSSPSTSSSISATPRSFRSSVNRNLFRPSHAHGISSLRGQNHLGRRLGTTAGVLRSQRTLPGRLTQLASQSSQDSSAYETSEQPYLRNRLLRLLELTQPTDMTTTSRQNTLGRERQIPLNRVGNTSSPVESNVTQRNLTSESSSIGTASSPMSKHRCFLERRRPTASRSLRSSRIRGAACSQSQSSAPPRFFGGRQSVFETTAGTPPSHDQRTSSLQTNAQTPVRTSHNMLMRIFHSLRRAATLSGRYGRQMSNETQPSQSEENHENIGATEPSVVEATVRDSTLQSQDSSPSSSQSSVRLWTQYSGPEGDVLHIRVPQVERIDSAVQDRLSRIRTNGTMNVVQDGVMTEDLARNLLRLHLHQQHQESQLRHHQARLRVRFHNQNTLRNVGQAQRELSRRLARCSLCGGSVYISSHFLVRLGTPSPDPPPAHSSSLSSPAWRQWPPPNPPPAHTSPPSPPLWRHESQQSPPASSSSARVATLHVPLQHLPEPAHAPLQPPLMQTDTVYHQSNAPLLSPSSPSPMLPSPTLSSTSPPPLPSPPTSQISSPPYLGGNSSTGSPGLSNHRVEVTGSSSLFWQVPASHNRSHTNQQTNSLRVGATIGSLPTNHHQQVFSHQQLPVATVTQNVVRDEETDIVAAQAPSSFNQEIQPSEFPNIDSPSTSSGISDSRRKECGVGSPCIHPTSKPPIVDSSSSDSDSNVVREQKQSQKRNITKSSDMKKRTGMKAEGKNAGSSSKLPSQHSSNSGSCSRSFDKSNSLKRKSTDNSSRKSSKAKAPGVYSSSSDSDCTTSEETRKCNNRKVSNSVGKTQKEKLKVKANRGLSSDSQGSVSFTQEAQEPSVISSTPETPTFQQLPEPTFTRQLEAITGRLDHLMFLQRNALDPPQRGRDGTIQDNSPLRNAGDSNNGSQENRRSSDAINISSRLLMRLTESLSRQIQMVQQVRVQSNSCNEHQESPSRPGIMNIGLQTNFAMINNTRRRGQELLSLMSDSLSTFSSQSGLPEEVEGNPAFQHVQTMSAAFWLLQGLYILLHLALELTDLLLSHYVFCYEPSDPEEGSTASVTQPCVCLNSNGSAASSLPPRPSMNSSHLWNGAVGPSVSPGPRAYFMHSVHEAIRSHIRSPRPPPVIGGNDVPRINGAPSTSTATSSVRRPWLVNLHNALASTRPSMRPLVLESFLRSGRSVQNEAQALVRIPVVPVPSYLPQVYDELSSESQEGPSASAAHSLVNPAIPSGSNRRNPSPASHTPAHQTSQSENSTLTPGPVASGNTRPGPLRLRSRLLNPPLIRQAQDRPTFSSEADMAAQQSLFFHFDYTRNIGHIVREPTFSTEEHRIHRIQLWDFSQGIIPNITKGDENLVVAECKIHNDASVDISADGHLLVALLPAPRPTVHPQLPSTPAGQTVGVYSLVWESLGQLLYTTSLDQPAVSVALSPTAAYLLVGLATRRTMLMPNDQHVLAQIFRLEGAKPGRPIGARGRLNSYGKIEVQNNHVSVGINCIRWAPVSGQGIVYGTNTGALVILR